jgi:hypothetical protein
MTVEDLVKKAEENGFKRADIVTGAKVYHNQPNIHHLTDEQIEDLDRRMSVRIEKTKTESDAATATNEKVSNIKRAKVA